MNQILLLFSVIFGLMILTIIFNIYYEKICPCMIVKNEPLLNNKIPNSDYDTIRQSIRK